MCTSRIEIGGQGHYCHLAIGHRGHHIGSEYTWSRRAPITITKLTPAQSPSTLRQALDTATVRPMVVGGVAR